MARFPTVSVPPEYRFGTRTMLPHQLNPDTDARPDPFRWTRTETTQARHHFHSPDHPPHSQRQFARDNGVPRSTLGHWLRHHRPADPHPEPALIAFPGHPRRRPSPSLPPRWRHRAAPPRTLPGTNPTGPFRRPLLRRPAGSGRPLPGYADPLRRRAEATTGRRHAAQEDHRLPGRELPRQPA